MDLDDLLEDLQSALPPELQVPTPEPGGTGSRANGQDHFYDHAEDPPQRVSVGSNSTSIVVRYVEGEEEEEEPFDDVQYSEVRKGPLYVPGSGAVPAEAPPEPNASSPPPSKPPRDSLGATAGLSELDSLLEMLNDTQIKIEKAVSHGAA